MIRSSDTEIALGVAKFLHSQRGVEAAQLVVEANKLRGVKLRQGDGPSVWEPILQHYVHWLLEHDGMAEVAQILWTPTQFTPEPASVQAVWNLYETATLGLIMGAGSMGKSYSMGVRLMMEWMRDPQWTSVRVLGPSENHLEENLFSHLVSLHQHATLKMPGEVGDLFIGLDRRDQLSSVRGVVIPKGNVKKAGRLQGGHRRPRPFLHPVFGPLSRLFIFLDEIENIPAGIWHDINNVIGGVIAGDRGFKLFGAYNPSNPGDKVAAQAEPPFGWSDLDPDVHFRWKSKRGWDVLRLDAERCENVLQGKTIYPGLQTKEGLELMAQSSGGRNSPGYNTMGRGMYPPMGIEATIVPAGMIPQFIGEYIWVEPPMTAAADDLSLEGGDDCVRTLGKIGRATGIKFPPSLRFPEGRTVMFKDKWGAVIPRWGVEAYAQFVLPKGETRAMTDSVIDVNRRAGVRGEYYACDRTGNGAGVADLLKHEWSTAIHDVNYSESASETRLMLEDTKTCKELYDRQQTELLFALRKWAEFGYFLINPTVDMSRISQQLSQRRYRTFSGKAKAESKKDYMSRGYPSPNEMDSLTLLVHAARKGTGLIPSMRGDPVDLPGSNADMDDWPGPYQGGARVDPTNRTDYLDTAMQMPTEMGMPI